MATVGLVALVMLVGAIAYKAATNAWRVHRVRVLQAAHVQYIMYLASKEGSPPDFVKAVPEVRDLFVRAGLKDSMDAYMEPAGYGFVQQRHILLFDNLAVNDAGIAPRVMQKFREAEGVYLWRLKQAFSPIYWIETVLGLPAIALQYVGLPPGSVFGRIANVAAWVLAVVSLLVSLPDFQDLQRWLSETLRALLPW